jgi:catechol 2,3-dioxygenase-like lactoylglutathione lyase family enzyme
VGPRNAAGINIPSTPLGGAEVEACKPRQPEREEWMPLRRIDHITLNSSDLARTCAFYAEALGFDVQKMEGRGLTGAWMLLDGHPYVHLVSRAPEQSPGASGLVDHFALEATGPSEMRERLKNAGVSFRENPLPEFDIHQIIVHDPDGVKVELNFRGPAAPEA